MSWGRIDDAMTEHPKWVALEERFGGRVWADAMALWVSALCYANRHETDGEVSRTRLVRLTPLPQKDALAAADAMVAVGLMTVTETSYWLHDFLRYNKSRAQRQAEREKEAQRGRDRRASGNRPARVRRASTLDATLDATLDSAPDSGPASTPPSSLRPEDPDPDPDPDPRSSLRSDPRARRQPSDRELRGLGLAPPMRSSGSLVATWAAAYAEAYRRETGKAWLSRRAIERIVAGNPERPHERIAEALDSLAGWLAEVPEAERDATVEAVIAGAWADPWMRERGCPIANIASDPARYLGQRSAATQEPAGDPPDWHPVTHGAPSSARNFAFWNAWSAAGCPNDPSWRPRRRAEAAS